MANRYPMFGWGLVSCLTAALLAPAALAQTPPAPAKPVTPAPAKPATRPATRPAVPVATVESAVTALIADAEICFVPEPTKLITIIRPHPAVARVPHSQAHAALAAMAGKLTGDPYKDVYIRYHLMDVVNRAIDQNPEPLTAGLMALAASAPADVKIELRPWHTYDPPDIGERYHKLYWSTAVTVGFPPFHRTLWAPESFPYMDGPTRAKAEAAWAEAQTLKGKFREVDSPRNHTWNWRAIWLNWLIRQYRGELVYAMVAQGDAKAFDLIVDGIVSFAATDPTRATDFASFLNAAYFNGYLGRYSPAVLKQAANKLRAAAIASERAARDAMNRNRAARGPQSLGPTVSVGWINTGGRWRQVAEALFTIVYAIDNDRVPKPIAPADRIRPLVAQTPPTSPTPPVVGAAATRPTTAPATRPVVTPETLDLKMIDEAIARGVAALDTLRPPDVDLNYLSYVALRLPGNYWHSDFTLPGQGALTTWAMLSTGESELSTWMQRRLNWVLCYDSPTTYDRAMRLRLLSKMRRPDLQPWIRRDALWIVDTMTEQGNWEARNVGVRSAGFGDNANGQYAVLGLWAAAEAGVDLPPMVWQRVDQYWRMGQRPPGAPGDGGWAVTSSAALKRGANLNAFTNQVSASMTAGGVLSLYLTEMYLLGPKRVEVGQSLSPELLRGVNWLDQNFSLDNLDGDSDFYFYAWTIQNVGQAVGYRTFNDVDWFRHVAARLLNTQQPNGLWTGPKGPHVSTSFALLYLARARGPLAICKVRWEPNNDPPRSKPAGPVRPSAAAAAAAAAKTPRALAKANAWNNRPNDLYNFVTDVSYRTEVPTSWQIVDLDQPVHELAESALLYLATDKPFRMNPEQIARLREYIDAGGLLVCVPEGRSNSAVLNSMKNLAAELCPGVQPVRRTEASHPFYSIAAKLKSPIPTLCYEGLTRPRVVVVEADIGRGLQANDAKDRDAFNLLMNLYLYSAGLDPKRPRVQSSYLVQKTQSAKHPAAAARIKYAGDFDPEPLAMPQLKVLMADRFGVNLSTAVATPDQLVGSGTAAAFLTLSPTAALTDADVTQLRDWVKGGGMVVVDAAGGTPASLAKLDELLTRAGWDTDLKPLAGHALLTGRNVIGAEPLPSPLYRANRVNVEPKIQIRHEGDRPAVVVVRGDLCSGLAGTHSYAVVGPTVEAARALAANALLMAAPLPPPPPPPAPATRPTTGPATRPAVVATTRPTTPPAAPASQPAVAPASQPVAVDAKATP